MYDNQYDREINPATENAIKTQKRLFVYEFLQHVVHYFISNKILHSAIDEVIELALELIKLVLKFANSELKSPHQ